MTGLRGKSCRFAYLTITACLLTGFVPQSQAGGWFDKVIDKLSGERKGGSLSRADISKGLKQALEIGTGRAVEQIGVYDGFWKHPVVRIPLPDKLKAPARTLHKIGFGSLADDLSERMNRAAETAVPLARPIFVDAIKTMTIEDVYKIWKGPDDAATHYFEDRTKPRLIDVFAPIVHKELDRSGAVRSYRRFAKKYQSVPFIGAYLQFDLDAYVTEQALSGLFYVLAQEEKKIRRDPVARTTELLRRLFR